MFLKKITAIFCLITVSLVFTPRSAEATNECFEGVSRSIFKFNLAFDEVILEPIAKGYNKLPKPIKNGTSKAAIIKNLILNIKVGFIV